MTMTADVNTLAARIRENGGAGFKDSELERFHGLEVQERALAADTTISEPHRRDLRAQLHDRIDAALRADLDAEIAAGRKPLEQARAKALAEIKGTPTRRSDSIETTDAQRERLARQHINELRINNDIATANASSDPEWLRDLLEEAILAEQPDRTRMLGQVVMGRLRTLVKTKTPGAQEAFSAAFGRFDGWQKEPVACGARASNG